MGNISCRRLNNNNNIKQPQRNAHAQHAMSKESPKVVAKARAKSKAKVVVMIVVAVVELLWLQVQQRTAELC